MKRKMGGLVLVAGLIGVAASVPGPTLGQYGQSPSGMGFAGNQDVVMVGDMLLERDQLSAEKPGVNAPRATPGFNTYSSTPWPEGVLPVEFSDLISNDEKELFLQACSQWQRRSGVRCVVRVDESSYLRLVKGEGCWSYVGYSYGFGGMMSLGVGCWESGVILHELGHAFGLMHEH